MTPKQQTFVLEYLKDLNATKAADRAGMRILMFRERSSYLIKRCELLFKRDTGAKGCRLMPIGWSARAGGH